MEAMEWQGSSRWRSAGMDPRFSMVRMRSLRRSPSMRSVSSRPTPPAAAPWRASKLLVMYRTGPMCFRPSPSPSAAQGEAGLRAMAISTARVRFRDRPRTSRQVAPRRGCSTPHAARPHAVGRTAAHPETSPAAAPPSLAGPQATRSAFRFGAEGKILREIDGMLKKIKKKDGFVLRGSGFVPGEEKVDLISLLIPKDKVFSFK